MKVLVQWALLTAADWVEIDSSQWASLASRPEPRNPRGTDSVDSRPGWIYNLNVQGLSFGGADHYCVEDVAGGGLRVTVWNDDPEDIPEDDWHIEVWTLLPLAADPRLGGAINTRQSRIVYAKPAALARWTAQPLENTTVEPWGNFVEPDPAIVRHGIWVDDALAKRHDNAAADSSWRDWGEHLDSSELDSGGKVRSQRRQGRYVKPTGTITYFLHDTTLATGVHVADHEEEMEETDVASSTNVVCTIAASGVDRCFCWTTLANSPGDADWPSGDYRCQIDVQGAMNVGGYGFRTVQAVNGHFARVDSGLTSDSETFAQTESIFTGTGIKLATTGTINPSAGAAGDRAEWLCVASNSSSTMEATLTIRHDDTDSFSDGPWTAAGESPSEETRRGVVNKVGRLPMIAAAMMVIIGSLPPPAPAGPAELPEGDQVVASVKHVLSLIVRQPIVLSTQIPHELPIGRSLIVGKGVVFPRPIDRVIFNAQIPEVEALPDGMQVYASVPLVVAPRPISPVVNTPVVPVELPEGTRLFVSGRDVLRPARAFTLKAQIPEVAPVADLPVGGRSVFASAPFRKPLFVVVSGITKPAEPEYIRYIGIEQIVLPKRLRPPVVINQIPPPEPVGADLPDGKTTIARQLGKLLPVQQPILQAAQIPADLPEGETVYASVPLAVAPRPIAPVTLRQQLPAIAEALPDGEQVHASVPLRVVPRPIAPVTIKAQIPEVAALPDGSQVYASIPLVKDQPISPVAVRFQIPEGLPSGRNVVAGRPVVAPVVQPVVRTPQVPNELPPGQPLVASGLDIRRPSHFVAVARAQIPSEIPEGKQVYASIPLVTEPRPIDPVVLSLQRPDVVTVDLPEGRQVYASIPLVALPRPIDPVAISPQIPEAAVLFPADTDWAARDAVDSSWSARDAVDSSWAAREGSDTSWTQST